MGLMEEIQMDVKGMNWIPTLMVHVALKVLYTYLHNYFSLHVCILGDFFKILKASEEGGDDVSNSAGFSDSKITTFIKIHSKLGLRPQI